MKYAIAIAGFQPELIIKPFLKMLEPVDELMLLTTQNVKSKETARQVSSFLDFANVKTRHIEVEDIFNFFEVMVVLENLYKTRGNPLWINVSAGPGIAIASLTFFAINHNIMVVFYNKEIDRTSKVDISNSRNLFKRATRNNDLLKLIESGPQSLEELALKLSVSKSTASRRVKLLKAASLVETNIKNRKMSVSITNTSKKLLEN